MPKRKHHDTAAPTLPDGRTVVDFTVSELKREITRRGANPVRQVKEQLFDQLRSIFKHKYARTSSGSNARSRDNFTGSKSNAKSKVDSRTSSKSNTKSKVNSRASKSNAKSRDASSRASKSNEKHKDVSLTTSTSTAALATTSTSVVSSLSVLRSNLAELKKTCVNQLLAATEKVRRLEAARLTDSVASSSSQSIPPVVPNIDVTSLFTSVSPQELYNKLEQFLSLLGVAVPKAVIPPARRVRQQIAEGDFVELHLLLPNSTLEHAESNNVAVFLNMGPSGYKLVDSSGVELDQLPKPEPPSLNLSQWSEATVRAIEIAYSISHEKGVAWSRYVARFMENYNDNLRSIDCNPESQLASSFWSLLCRFDCTWRRHCADTHLDLHNSDWFYNLFLIHVAPAYNTLIAEHARRGGFSGVKKFTFDPASGREICRNFNKGKCHRDPCRYEHCCSLCGESMCSHLRRYNRRQKSPSPEVMRNLASPDGYF